MLGIHFIAQIIWESSIRPIDTGTGWRKRSKVISDESTHTEFDMGNLIEISRFAASDRYENGTHGAYGLRYSYNSNQKYLVDLGIGKILRKNDYYGFTESSGLRKQKSDNYVTSMIKLLNSYISFQGLLDKTIQKNQLLMVALIFQKLKLTQNIAIYRLI